MASDVAAERISSRRPRGSDVAIVGGVIVAALTALAVMHAANPRLLTAWHAFLHGAIALRSPASGVPPENPFFAGEPLPYYWVYHWLAGLGMRLLALDPVRMLQGITFASVAVALAAGAAIGRRHFRCLAAGLAVALLALAGGNPLGLLIAAAKALAGQPWWDMQPPVGDQLFVDNALADRLMTHPLLPAMHFTGDWRYGHNLPWLFDISSRTPALALVLVFALVWLARARPLALAAVAIASALLTAINPLFGLGLVGALCAVDGIAALFVWRRDGFGAAVRSLARAGAALAGVLLALPTFFHMLLLEGTSRISPPGLAALKVVVVGTVFLLLAPAAVLGPREAPADVRVPLRSLLLAGLLLVALIVAVNLEEGNEHNLSNLAQVVLAVPAGAYVTLAWRRRGGTGRGALVLLALLCLPTSVGTVLAFSGRPALPLSIRGERLVRLPADGPVQRSYDWIRASTPADAVLITDPGRALKMAGNVSELPVFTGRALFADHPSYLVTPHADYERRVAIAGRLQAGGVVPADDAAYLRTLRRPLFLYTHTTDPAVQRRLVAAWGTPAFAAPPVAVFRLDP